MIGGAKGIGIGLDFGIGNIKRPTKQSSLDPAIKEALCGVWIADQNTNESPTRNIIKNKIKDRGGDFEILNAAYKGNSGYGKYNYDYTTWYYDRTLTNIINSTKVEYFAVKGSVGFYNITLGSYKGRIKITGLNAAIQSGKVQQVQVYNLNNNSTRFVLTKDGIYDVDLSFETNGIYMFALPKGNYSGNLDIPIYIEQVPEYQGAFCTDGVDDMIVSKKPVGEMLGGSNEITVVSMIHQIDENITDIRTNFIGILNAQNYWLDNLTSKNGINKTGIYGYTYDGNVINTISNVLGDYNDYKSRQSNDRTTNAEFSVEGFRYTLGLSAVSQVAWYWTLIAKRVLTTDEINQVIAYYNLDKYVAPDIYYDVKKQGLTNENHAEFGDKLIDYSGNGKDMQLYNFGWKLDSGVGKYEEDFADRTTWASYNGVISTSTKISLNSNFNANNAWIIFKPTNQTLLTFNVNISGIPNGGELQFYSPTKKYLLSNGENHIEFDNIITAQSSGFRITNGHNLDWSNLVIEQLPSFENALVFDGVDDYGQYVGDLGLKDYTVVVDRAYVELTYRQIPFVSSNKIETNTPFILEYSVDLETYTNPCSYGNRHSVAKPIDKNRKVSYQSTYVYNGNAITKGTSTNTGDGLTFGRYGDNAQYAALCLYNFMLFPYSLSEFLIERQLKKRKLGTLHPVVKFKPNIEGNEPFEILKYEKVSETGVHSDLQIGDYIPIGQEICISIKLSDSTSKLSKVTSSSLTDITFGMPPNLPFGSIYGKVTDESPQVIILYIENNQQGGGG